MRLLTPRGIGGVAVVAAEDAAEARALLDCLATPGGRRAAPEPGGPPVLARLCLDGAVRDEVLAVARPHGLEVHLHGSPQLVAELEARFGPFRRAPVAAADMLLRAALAPEQVALCAEQRRHDFAMFLRQALALPAAAREAALAAALRRTAVARAHLEPCRVVLAGQQNAGKSTLFNRLLFRERALAGERPGLTRDPVREAVALQGYPYELVDTAGEGEVAAAADVAALARARAERGGALLLLVVDSSRGPGPRDRELLGHAPLVVASKADLEAAPWPADVPCAARVSARDPASAPALRLLVGELLRRFRGLPPAGPVGGPAALDEAAAAALRRAAGARGGGQA